MYIEGNYVGVVHSPAEAEIITDILCGQNSSYQPDMDLHLRFLSFDGFTSAATLLENAQTAIGIETEIVTETQSVPFAVTTVNDDSLLQGEERVDVAGADGTRVVVKRILRQNDRIIREEILSDTVSVAPVSQTVSVGTMPRPAGVGSGEFALPLQSITVSSNFGLRWNRQHDGIDLAADSGTDILASDSGIVTFSGVLEGYGNLIILDHRNGFTTYYAHCSALYAGEGAMVEKGEIIGAVGSTGNSTGPHLHFEIRQNDVPLNPLDFLPSFT